MDTHDPVTGRLFDGLSAKDHPVHIVRGSNVLQITFDETGVIEEWPLSSLREMQDQAERKGISLSVVGTEKRLLIDDVNFATWLRSNSSNLSIQDVPKGTAKRLLMYSAAAIASVCLILFVIVPALANTLANYIPVAREVALGNGAIKQIERFLSYGENPVATCSTPDGDAALQKMSKRLAATFENPYPLDIRVFDHKLVNAFAVPGGHVILFDGLLQSAETPEEIAGVLGHEFGHVINRDPTRLALRSAGSVGILGMVFGDFAGGAFALILAEQLIAANYAQDAESNADIFALTSLEKASLPSAPFASFFDKLVDEHGEDDGLLSHIASHPALGERAERARVANTIEGDFVAVLSDDEWQSLKRICDEHSVNNSEDATTNE